jgi:general stress protein 26
MTALMPTAQLVGEFSDPDARALPWEAAEALLASAEMFWLSTVRPDGRPHVAPLPGIWLDGAMHFCTGAHEQKARNIETNPMCVMTTGTNEFRSGLDVVVEGRAERVTETAMLTRLAGEWERKLGWVFQVGGGVFLDTTADDHAALVFGVVPMKVLAFTKSPYSQTRYRF